jgi:hypothetical protein
MRKAFHLFWISFVITTFFIAPFLQDRDQSKKAREQTVSVAGFSNKVVELTADAQRKDILIQSNNNTFQIQSATITAYQAENTTLNRKLSDIESANDPSAKAIKRRALILCKQLEEFYQEYETNQNGSFDQWIQQERIETLKLGWPPPTNEVEKLQWQERRNKQFNEFTQKEQALEAQWSARYMTEFYGRVASMRDQLAGIGLESKQLNERLENRFYSNVFWSRETTMQLEHLANQIKE